MTVSRVVVFNQVFLCVFSFMLMLSLQYYNLQREMALKLLLNLLPHFVGHCGYIPYGMNVQKRKAAK